MATQRSLRNRRHLLSFALAGNFNFSPFLLFLIYSFIYYYYFYMSYESFVYGHGVIGGDFFEKSEPFLPFLFYNFKKGTKHVT
jgi:hypothetical protein